MRAININREKILELKKLGISAENIARRFSCSRDTIYGVIREHNRREREKE